MSIQIYLLFLLIILLIVLLIKYYLDSKHAIMNDKQNIIKNVNNNLNYNKNVNITNNPNSFEKHNDEFSKMLDKVHKDTMQKINNAVEQGVIEGFANYGYDTDTDTDANDYTYTDANISDIQSANLKETIDSFQTDDVEYYNDFNIKNIKSNTHKYKETMKNKHNNDNIISYLNKNNSVKLMLFYKVSCPYCSDFMPIWYKIVNNLSNNIMYEEIDCEKDYKKANEYQITSIPTIILLVNNEKKMYMGDRNYSDIMQFLKYNGVNLVERTFEEFDSTGYSTEIVPSSNNNKSLCPNVTFNSELDVSQDNYLFQIFNENGQYGYASGGNNSDKIMSPFTAAYSTIDSYLTSLPNGANISQCDNNYSDQIRGFGLCDKEKLDNILEYQTNVSQGNSKYRIDDTDYSTNKDVVTAIKNACKL